MSGAAVNVWRPDGVYSVSTVPGGPSRIWDERGNAYVTDEAGEALEFVLPYEAEQYLKARTSCASCAELDDYIAELPERPTADTDPGECRWCFEEASGGRECPYHGETAQREV